MAKTVTTRPAGGAAVKERASAKPKVTTRTTAPRKVVGVPSVANRCPRH